MRASRAATARGGGDQFMLCLADCSKDRILPTSRHARNSGNIVVILESLIVMIGGWFCVSESIGIALQINEPMRS